MNIRDARWFVGTECDITRIEVTVGKLKKHVAGIDGSLNRKEFFNNAMNMLYAALRRDGVQGISEQFVVF